MGSVRLMVSPLNQSEPPMCTPNLNDAYEFYNGYAKHARFSVRKESTRTTNVEIV